MSNSVVLSAPVSRAKKTLKISLTILASLGLLALFTATKISENVVRDWALSLMNQAIAPQSMALTAEEFHLGFLPKPNIELKKVNIQNLTTNQYFQLEAIQLAPSGLSLFTGKLGVDIYVPMGEGSIDATLGLGGRNFSASIAGNKLDLHRILALAGFPGIKTKGQLSLKLELSGDLYTPPTWNGEFTLEGKSIALLQQNLMGIELPTMNISEVKNKVSLNSGKAKIVDGQFGKAGDDLVLTLTGDFSLQNRIEDSFTNLKASLRLSQNVTSSLTLLDAILSSSKQPDGSYGYLISGSIFAPLVTPMIGSGIGNESN